MITAGHHTMMNNTVKYPWDYRVEYFQVATTYSLFECGPLKRYNENWTDELDLDANSTLQSGIRNNIKGWIVFSFPNPATQDQKNCGGTGTFCCYPYSGRYNIGGWYSWFTAPSVSDVASLIATNTKTMGFLESIGSDVVRYGVRQGSAEWSGTYNVSSKRFRTAWNYPVLLYDENGYQVRNVSIGTRFYESGFDFNIPGNLEMHVRFVPCMKDNTPFICEMNSGTMIPNSMSGTVTPGPQVPDDYESYQQMGGR